MSNLLNVENIQAGRPYAEWHTTRFDQGPEQTEPFFVPEQRQGQPDMFTHNPHLEVQETSRAAAELAIPADMFTIPQTEREVTENQEAYLEAITATAEQTRNVESLDGRRYASDKEAYTEVAGAGLAFEIVRAA